MRQIVRILIAALSFLAASCTHKELCYDHTHTREINVVFDWSKAPGAEPKSMSLYLFPENGGDPIRHEFTDRNGGRIRIVTGRYKAIFLNSDRRDITIHNGHDYDLFCITTKDAGSTNALGAYGVSLKSLPKTRQSENERWVRMPEEIWSGSLEDILITSHEQTITLTPQPHIRNYHVDIRNISNLKWIKGMSASLTSMSGGHHPSSGQESSELVTIPFETSYNINEGQATGRLTTFGHCPEYPVTHQLIIYAILADDSKWYHTYDVTSQIHDAEDPFNIYITIDELPFPKPVVNGGGFKPSVGEWKHIEINIKM